MGAAARSFPISDASGRHPTYSDAARSLIDDFWHDEGGSTAIEYAIMAAGIAMVIITAVNALGDAVKSALFDKIVAAF
jgi:pilus assembly protein Flp/PilA